MSSLIYILSLTNVQKLTIICIDIFVGVSAMDLIWNRVKFPSEPVAVKKKAKDASAATDVNNHWGIPEKVVFVSLSRNTCP